MPLRMSVWPVAIQIRTPDGIGIIDAPGRRAPVPGRRRRTGIDDDARSFPISITMWPR